MRILQVCPYLYPALSYGGPAKFVYELSVELAKNHQVTVLTSDTFDQTRTLSAQEIEQINSKQNLHVIHFSNLVNSWAFRYKFFTHFGIAYWFIRNAKSFDIVHIHDIYIFPQIFLFVIAKLMRKPVIISPHGVLDPIRTEKLSLIKKALNAFLILPMLKRSNLLIALNPVERDYLKEVQPERTKLIQNGVRENLDFTPKKNITSKKLKLLYIGRLHEKKGLRTLISALEKFPYSIALTIAGPDDGIEEELKEKISVLRNHDVQMIGFVNRPQKIALFAEHDIFIYPSYSEGFSIAIIEAMSFGLPVLITTGCHFDLVAERKAGWIADVDDLEAQLVETLKQAWEDRSLLAEFSTNAYNLVKTEYSISLTAQRYQKAYQSLL